MERYILFIFVFVSFLWLSNDALSKKPEYSGSDLFSSKCAACHGVAGGGTGMLKPLKGSEFLKKAKSEDIQKIILDGTKGGMIPMPAMKDKLTLEEIDAIVRYLKSLK